MTLYDELIWRGLIKDVSDETLAKQRLNDEKINFYCGFDPTGESLTIGHLVQIVRMMLLQKHGHTPIVLIGGGTGLIGDPREVGERKLLTVMESLKNADLIKKQLEQYFISEKTIFVNNYDWIKNIDLIAFLRNFGKHFSINYMLAKDTVQRRLEDGISYTEFSYMLLQAIDFLHLYRHHECLLQFGGSDQWGNITTGLELIRKMSPEGEKAIGLSSPLLLKADGEKFGKSESGAIWLDENLTTPYEIYQYFLNVSDTDVIAYLKALTLLEKEVIMDLEKAVQEHPEQRLAQKQLAISVTKLVHGEQKMNEAIRVTEALFMGEFDDLTESEWKMIAKAVETHTYEKEIPLIDALIDTKLASSRREAREFINNNAVSINDQKLADIDAIITNANAYFEKYVMIKRGKKKYALIAFK